MPMHALGAEPVPLILPMVSKLCIYCHYSHQRRQTWLSKRPLLEHECKHEGSASEA
jgi:hypothetical protein